MTSLIGREDEITAVTTLFEEAGARLVTLTGPGGIGKTRLALGVAGRLDDLFPDGVWFVPLASIADPDLVVPTIARVLEIVEQADQPLLDRLTDHLREWRALLLLDNFEHVVAASIAIAELLAACPALGALITSREPLHLSGEHEYSVPPLEIATSSNGLVWAPLPDSEAVRLFVERARLVSSGFTLTISNAPKVIEICRRLDGVPLALELAAARIKMLSPDELLERLDQPLALLTGGPRDAPVRQQTMRATLQWSYDLLPPEEQQVFRQLAVFAGGWTLAAAEAVLGDGDILRLLSSLVDKGLVRRVELPSHPTRYGMLEPVRQFAAECLIERGDEARRIRDQHAAYFQSITQDVQNRMDGPDGPAEADRIEAEHDNLRAALRWLRESDQIEQGLLLVSELGNFWFQRGYVNEGWAHVETFLNAPVTSRRTIGRARALWPASRLQLARGEVEAAFHLIDEARDIFEEHEDRPGEARAQFMLGVCRDHLGDEEQARSDIERALALLCEVGNDAYVVRALAHLGKLAHRQGDLERARDLLEEAIGLARTRRLTHVVALVLGDLGPIAELSGDDDQAADFYSERLALYYELGNPRGLAQTLKQMASFIHRQGQLEPVVCLLGVAAALRERSGHADVAIDVDKELDELRAALPDPVVEAAWTRGWEMALEEAIDLARLSIAAASRDDSPASLPAGLTPREAEVLRLIAAGRSNREMADDLFLSVRTVERHITNIYAKINAHNRAEATAFALANGIAGPAAT